MGQGGQSSSSATASGVWRGSPGANYRAYLETSVASWGHQEPPKPGTASSSTRSVGETACPGPARPQHTWVLKFVGGLMQDPFQDNTSLHTQDLRKLSCCGELEPRGLSLPAAPSRPQAWKRRLVFPVLHSEVLGGLGSILKNFFETHLELILEVLARVGSMTSLGFCVCGGAPHTTVAVWDRGLRSWFRGFVCLWAACQVCPHTHCTWLPREELSQCHPDPSIQASRLWVLYWVESLQSQGWVFTAHSSFHSAHPEG